MLNKSIVVVSCYEPVLNEKKKGVTCMLLTMLFSRWALIPEKLGGGSVTDLLKLLLYFRKKN